jgi:DNA-binding winged helix-turn-helix (wHTH) protein/Tol biopolymer transport system component
MPLSHTEKTVRFGQFELDLRTRQLTKNGAKIRLSRQPIQVLSLLLENPGEIVTREEFRRRLWSSDVFVDFDHGLNKSIQKLRNALGDSAGSPRYIETIPRIGYRFIALGNEARGSEELPTKTGISEPPAAPALPPGGRIDRNRWARWILLCASVVACVLGFFAVGLDRSRHRPAEVRFTRLTDFTDSAVAPALSPDGHMVAFIRGDSGFLTSDEIYVKILPNGETTRVTDDHRPKYGLAFSPDGAEIAYTVLEGSRFSTYEVSALGGEPHLLLENAAGLVWLDRYHLLFSEVRAGEGIHLGVVTATVTRTGLREIYFPAHERGMAHYSYASPDRRWALVVEMNENGDWAPCRLVDLEGRVSPRPIGPVGACTSAGWSANGRWMYFTVKVDGQSHIWQQHFPVGEPEQITFGPTEEDGLAVEAPALITSVGVHESALWMHDGNTERPLSSEGEVVGGLSPPVFSPDASVLYYLLRQGQNSGAELRRTVVESGKSEVVLPGIPMISFDLSADGKQVVYTTVAEGGTQLWLAPLDRSNPPRKVDVIGAQSPHFGVEGQVLFQHAEGDRNYLERVDADGAHRSRVVPFPILEFQGVSPGRRWVIAVVPATPESNIPAVTAIPLAGGVARRISTSYCFPRWSPDGRFLFVPVEETSRAGPGRSLAIPIGPGENLPDFPAGGIAPLAEPSVVPGAMSVSREDPLPGRDPEHYAWVNTTVHRNLYRISLP